MLLTLAHLRVEDPTDDILVLDDMSVFCGCGLFANDGVDTTRNGTQYVMGGVWIEIAHNSVCYNKV